MLKTPAELMDGVLPSEMVLRARSTGDYLARCHVPVIRRVIVNGGAILSTLAGLFVYPGSGIAPLVLAMMSTIAASALTFFFAFRLEKRAKQSIRADSHLVSLRQIPPTKL